MGLASGLMAGGYNMTSGFNLFIVDIDLTLEGISKENSKILLGDVRFFSESRSMGNSALYYLSIHCYAT